MNFLSTSLAQAGSISDATPIATILQNVLDFLLSIVGLVAIIALVIAGILYLTANGDTKRISVAKKAFGFAIIGIVIALGSLIVVSQIGEFFAT